MNSKKSYPVTNEVNNLSEPHVIIETRPKNVLCSGWFPFVLIGIGAILFLVFVDTFGGSKLFMTAVNIYADLVPIIKKGYLQVIPFRIKSISSKQNTFFVKLPLKAEVRTSYIQALDDLLKEYPEKYEEPYANCWLENPTKNHPCFYERSWIAQTCLKKNSYGYDLDKEEYSPCFVMKFRNTKDWIPRVPNYSFFGQALSHSSENFDSGFIPVLCVAQDVTRTDTVVDIEVYPPKGFSLLYFPQSNFNESIYLPPLVAVKVKGIQKNTTITVDCAIATPNAFVLERSGRFSVTFSST